MAQEAFEMPYLYFHIWDPRCRHYSRVYTLDGIILKVYSNQRYWCVCVCLCVWKCYSRILAVWKWHNYVKLLMFRFSMSVPHDFQATPLKTSENHRHLLPWFPGLQMHQHPAPRCSRVKRHVRSAAWKWSERSPPLAAGGSCNATSCELWSNIRPWMAQEFQRWLIKNSFLI